MFFFFLFTCRGGHRGHGVHARGGGQRGQHQRRRRRGPLQSPEQLQRQQLHGPTFPQTAAAPLLNTGQHPALKQLPHLCFPTLTLLHSGHSPSPMAPSTYTRPINNGTPWTNSFFPGHGSPGITQGWDAIQAFLDLRPELHPRIMTLPHPTVSCLSLPLLTHPALPPFSQPLHSDAPGQTEQSRAVLVGLWGKCVL